MSLARLTLKPGKEQSLLRYHPWVFSGAIARTQGTPADGDPVEVYDSQGHFMALGHYQPGSIMVRVLSFQDQPLDRAFWLRRLEQALETRRRLGLWGAASTNMLRLVHGEADGLPGLVVDVYGGTAVVQAHSMGMFLMREVLAQLIVEAAGGAIAAVYHRSQGALPFRAAAAASNGYLVGGPAREVLRENGCEFVVSWEDGQKTGFFVDQRDSRRLLEGYCHGATVLNAFGYTGGFSVFALRGGAQRVVTLDSSARALALAEQNVARNFPGTAGHQAVCADAFDYLNQPMAPWDVIVLDPPAFAKHTTALRNALQAYKRLNAAAMNRIKPGGILFTFSCSQVVSREQFRNAVFSAGVIARRPVKILHQLTQPADHPISIYHPEGEYLKGLVLLVE